MVTALRRRASRMNVSSTGFRGCEEAATNGGVSPSLRAITLFKNNDIFVLIYAIMEQVPFP